MPRPPRIQLAGANDHIVTRGDASRLLLDAKPSPGQQIQGGQQIAIWDLTALGRKNSWLTGAVAGFSFILNRLNLLASLNLLENRCLHEAAGEFSWPDQVLRSG